MAIDIKGSIEQLRSMGTSEEAIKTILLNMGAPLGEVEAALINSSKPIDPLAQNIPANHEPVPNIENNLQAPLPHFQPTSGDVGVGNTQGNFTGQSSVPNLAGSVIANDPVTENFINKWSWGAFLFGWIYFLASRMTKRGIGHFFALFLGPIYLVFMIMAGINGRRKVWGSGKWQDFESFKKRQKTLDVVGLALFALGIISTVLATVLFPSAVSDKPANNAAIVENATTTQMDTNITTSSNTSSTATTTAAVIKTIINCGTISENVESFSLMEEGTVPPSPEDTETLKCMDKVFLECLPAKFTVTGNEKQPTLFEILGNSSGDCMWSMKNSGSLSASCKIIDKTFLRMKSEMLSQPDYEDGIIAATMIVSGTFTAGGFTSSPEKTLNVCEKL